MRIRIQQRGRSCECCAEPGSEKGRGRVVRIDRPCEEESDACSAKASELCASGPEGGLTCSLLAACSAGDGLGGGPVGGEERGDRDQSLLKSLGSVLIMLERRHAPSQDLPSWRARPGSVLLTSKHLGLLVLVISNFLLECEDLITSMWWANVKVKVNRDVNLWLWPKNWCCQSATQFSKSQVKGRKTS